MADESNQHSSTSPTHRLALPSGTLLGKYRLDAVLGSGGFGITYLAHDSALHRKVAIKELLPSDFATRVDGTTVVARETSLEGDFAWARDRFIAEGRTLATCEHPAVLQVYDTFDENGTAYLVTKFEEGRTLTEWRKELGRRPIPAELRVLVRHVLGGLSSVHEKGFLHRDLKPDNIYLTDEGQPILLDFGAARQAVCSRSRPVTSIVSPGFAPFEQYSSQGEHDGSQGPWSDIYAMAAVLYWCLLGKKPLDAPTRFRRELESLVEREELLEEFEQYFLEAIDAGLRMEPEDRPQSASEWHAMLLGKSTPPTESEGRWR